MEKVKLVAVFAANKLGQMAKITKVLADAKISIHTVIIASSKTFGVIKFLVDKPEAAYRVFKKNGFTATLNEVLAVEMNDSPGGLYSIAETLAGNEINVENASGFALCRGEKAVLLIEVENIGRARKKIKKTGLRLLGKKELRID